MWFILLQMILTQQDQIGSFRIYKISQACNFFWASLAAKAQRNQNPLHFGYLVDSLWRCPWVLGALPLRTARATV